MKVCVVIRHIIPLRPVTSTVILPPPRHIDDLNHYFNSLAKEHITEFKKRFVEFNDAHWHIDIIDVE